MAAQVKESGCVCMWGVWGGGKCSQNPRPRMPKDLWSPGSVPLWPSPADSPDLSLSVCAMGARDQALRTCPGPDF